MQEADTWGAMRVHARVCRSAKDSGSRRALLHLLVCTYFVPKEGRTTEHVREDGMEGIS